jgi:hypothetical protein
MWIDPLCIAEGVLSFQPFSKPLIGWKITWVYIPETVDHSTVSFIFENVSFVYPLFGIDHHFIYCSYAF